jgi:prolyl-tRNA editing enzyme YbaK/EbsC (Cys-tRNA(Pro) deacylase)
MPIEWPEPVEQVAAALRRNGVEAKIEMLATSAGTVEEVASALGVSPGQILQTVVLLCGEDPVVVLVPGDRRLSAPRVAAALGRTEARLASPAEAEELTGFASGLVPPLLLPSGMRVYIDRSFVTRRRVWASAGAPDCFFSCVPADIAAITRADLMDATGTDG